MLIATELDLKVPIIDPVKFVAKIANKAGLIEKTKRKAIGIMNDAITRKISDGTGGLRSLPGLSCDWRNQIPERHSICRRYNRSNYKK
jgi:hypothetical protein